MRLRNRIQASPAGGGAAATVEPRGYGRSPALLALAAMGASLIAVLSWISLPLGFTPVPLTLQTLGVLLVGGLLGMRWGVASVAVFLLLGMVGLPVFHGGTSGPGILVGPTGGYLLGFLPAALVMGLFAWLATGRAARTNVALLGAGTLLATGCVYLLGVPWLSLITGLSGREAVAAGLLPFIPGDLIKAGLAVVLLRAIVPARPPRPSDRGGAPVR
jgi:biotin transport system substrate-specific component